MRKKRPRKKSISAPSCETDLRVTTTSNRENWIAFKLCDGKLEAPFEEFVSPQDEFTMVALARVYLDKKWNSLANQALPNDS